MTTKRYRLDLPQAQRLAWLYGVDKDLMIAEELMEWCSNDRDQRESGVANTEEAFWTAAVIRYGRCFGTGRRHWDPMLAIQRLNPEQQDYHRYFCLVRDEMYAHSIDLGEDYTPLAFLTEFDNFSEIVNVGTGATRVSSLGVHLAIKFVSLIQALRAIVQEMLEHERLSLLQLVRSMPIGEIKAMGEWSTSLEVTPSEASVLRRLAKKIRKT